MTNNKDKKTEVTTFDVQVAEFIRNHKKQGSAADDEINDQLVIPFTLDADGIDDLLQRIQDAGISIVDKKVIHRHGYYELKKNQHYLTKNC